MKAVHITASLGAALCLLLTACLPQAPEPTPTRVPVTCADLTACAWAELDSDPETAIECAQECIELFEGEALAQQEALDEAPPVGEVDEETEAAIYESWALNGVGTSYYIVGQASARLGRIEEAKEAYREAQRFPYARTWDPGFSGFWSPAEAASKELGRLD